MSYPTWAPTDTGSTLHLVADPELLLRTGRAPAQCRNGRTDTIVLLPHAAAAADSLYEQTRAAWRQAGRFDEFPDVVVPPQDAYAALEELQTWQRYASTIITLIEHPDPALWEQARDFLSWANYALGSGFHTNLQGLRAQALRDLVAHLGADVTPTLTALAEEGIVGLCCRCRAQRQPRGSAQVGRSAGNRVPSRSDKAWQARET